MLDSHVCGCSETPSSASMQRPVVAEQEGSPLKVYTLSTRLEMYVNQAVWHSLTRQAYHHAL